MAKEYKVTKSFTFDNKRYYVRADTEKEALVKMINKQRNLEEGKITYNGNTTVKEWANTCVDTFKTNVAPITLKNYKGKMNKYIIEEIGNMRVKDVKPIHLQKILNSMQGKAQYTIKKISEIMKFIFGKAVENKLILESPTQGLVVPKGSKSTHRAITSKERATIIAVAEKNPKFVYFLVMLFCGLRPSEVQGLRGNDIQVIDGTPMFNVRGSKSDSAIRYVPIPDYLYERLPKPTFDYIFKNERGNKMTNNNNTTLWNNLRREMNIALGCKVIRNQVIPPYRVAPDLVPYCLRHTFCTDLQKNGVDIRTAQYLMGHADIRMTANIYTHTDTEELIKVSKKLNQTGATVGATPYIDKT